MTKGDVNTDMEVRKVVDTSLMEWEGGANPTVWRKVLYRASDELEMETCVIRYDAGGFRESHVHPAGEELLVLKGTLSDEGGDHNVGSYMLLPPGTEHAPHTKQGCELLVRLGQYHGTSRAALTVECETLNWLPGLMPGVSVKILYRQHGYAESMAIVRWEPETEVGTVFDGGNQEIFVLEGSFHDEQGSYGPGTWIRSPEGFSHTPGSRDGCKMYVSNLEALDSGPRISDLSLDD